MTEAAAQKQLVGSFDDLIASVVDYDVAELRKMNMAASEALIKAIFKLNGVSLIKREEEKNG
jgi:hypothetical protein